MVLNTLPLTTSAAGQWYYHALRLLDATVLEVGSYSTARTGSYLQRFAADTLVGTPVLPVPDGGRGAPGRDRRGGGERAAAGRGGRVLVA